MVFYEMIINVLCFMMSFWSRCCCNTFMIMIRNKLFPPLRNFLRFKKWSKTNFKNNSLKKGNKNNKITNQKQRLPRHMSERKFPRPLLFSTCNALGIWNNQNLSRYFIAKNLVYRNRTKTCCIRLKKFRGNIVFCKIKLQKSWNGINILQR